MITPSPTTKLSPDLARGVLAGVVEATATKPGYIRFGVPDTSYEMHLIPTGPISAGLGKRLVGRIAGEVRRMDLVKTGGRYLEPVAGRPRRVQGTVVKVDDASNTITINAGVALHCKLTDPRQKASNFEVGQLVSGDMIDGATFTPAD